jgi:hypothetical protein
LGTEPFTFSLEQISDINLAKDELLDLHNNLKLHFDSDSMKLGKFWCKLGEAISILNMPAYKILVHLSQHASANRDFCAFL